MFAPNAAAEEFLPYFERLTEDDWKKFYSDMVTVRRFDTEATNLQRQGQLALWVPSHGKRELRSVPLMALARRTTFSLHTVSTPSP
jgi:TPP-dependent pyruvate/acetoin dehydrogenase alpha subunit